MIQEAMVRVCPFLKSSTTSCSCACVHIGRKTEEGFLIYKEAELKINPEAGGMFSSVAQADEQEHRFVHSIVTVVSAPPINIGTLSDDVQATSAYACRHPH